MRAVLRALSCFTHGCRCVPCNMSCWQTGSICHKTEGCKACRLEDGQLYVGHPFMFKQYVAHSPLRPSGDPEHWQTADVLHAAEAMTVKDMSAAASHISVTAVQPAPIQDVLKACAFQFARLRCHGSPVTLTQSCSILNFAYALNSRGLSWAAEALDALACALNTSQILCKVSAQLLCCGADLRAACSSPSSTLLQSHCCAWRSRIEATRCKASHIFGTPLNSTSCSGTLPCGWLMLLTWQLCARLHQERASSGASWISRLQTLSARFLWHLKCPIISRCAGPKVAVAVPQRCAACGCLSCPSERHLSPSIAPAPSRMHHSTAAAQCASFLPWLRAFCQSRRVTEPSTADERGALWHRQGRPCA